ncbi:MAG: hypothetical protein AB1631_23515 [Acidobacteriota bacterium]
MSLLVVTTKQEIAEALSGIDCRSTGDVDEAGDMLLSPHRTVDVVVVDLAVADWQGFVRWLTDSTSAQWIAISERADLSLRIEAAQLGVAGFFRWSEGARKLKGLIDSLSLVEQ